MKDTKTFKIPSKIDTNAADVPMDQIFNAKNLGEAKIIVVIIDHHEISPEQILFTAGSHNYHSELSRNSGSSTIHYKSSTNETTFKGYLSKNIVAITGSPLLKDPSYPRKGIKPHYEES